MSGIPWSDQETMVVKTHYQSGGWKACLPHLPGRTKKTICQKAFYMNLCHRAHLGGRRNGGRRPKRDAECLPYRPSPAEQRQIEAAMQLFGPLREFGVITRAGNLVPIIEVRYDEAA